MAYRKSLLLFLLLIGLAGCAGSDIKIEPVTITDNPSDKIFQLEETLAAGRAEQINILAPKRYAQAERYLDKARYGLAHNSSVNAILENVAFGHAYYDEAKKYAEIARKTIPRAIKARDLANAAGAAIFSQDYQDMEDRFVALTMDIESDHLRRAKKSEAKVAQGYAELELRAIKEKTLGEVRSLLAQAQDNGAAELTPTILALAQRALREADEFITEQRYEREKMQEKANFALFQAQRVGQIMALSDKLSLMTAESIALWSEARLHQITTQLGARDLRNEPTELQQESVIQSIVSLQDDISSLKELRQHEQEKAAATIAEQQSVIEAQQQQIAELEGRSKKVQQERELIAQKEQDVQARLAEERRFQQLFNEVQKMFAPDQAEVYKQADNLVIRLKAMQFPVGKDLIMPDNYPLLSLVRNAIRTFGEPNVVIEGHTDSTGSAAINEQLSRNRAEAVRQYFLANGTLNAEKVTALGYGSDRPLAPNDTVTGRAINRRIDIVIKTGQSQK